MNKNTFTAISLPAIILLPLHFAHALDLSYTHTYEDISKQHTEKLEASHRFDSGIGVGTKFKFSPKKKENGDEGDAFDNNKLKEKEFKLNYSANIAPGWALEPGMAWTIKKNEDKYKPSLKLKYRYSSNSKFSLKYSDEISDRRGKDTKRVNRIDAEYGQKFGAIEITNTLTYFLGNMDLYNKSRSDYEYELDLGYQITQHLLPYISFKNESVDDDTSQRQTEFGVGITYSL